MGGTCSILGKLDCSSPNILNFSFVGCVRDDECEKDSACLNRICMNPCDCGKGAECFLSNHRPVCQCPEGTVGNPQIECKPVGCQSDSECQDREACSNGKCINPCLLDDPCGANAECYPQRHVANCRCVSGYDGDPFRGCIPIGCQIQNAPWTEPARTETASTHVKPVIPVRNMPTAWSANTWLSAGVRSATPEIPTDPVFPLLLPSVLKTRTAHQAKSATMRNVQTLARNSRPVLPLPRAGWSIRCQSGTPS